MTEEQFNEIQKTFSKRSLSDDQKNIILSTIYREVGKTEFQSIPGSVVDSPINYYFSFFKHKTFVIMASFLLLLSGTAYASAQSLPGDLLYRMKVNMIEPTVLAFKFSEESKNEYKIELLQKRIEELEKLNSKSALDLNSQKESFKATVKNIKILEKSSIFNEQGENQGVSEQIKIYNGLMGDDLKVDTKIEIELGSDLEVKKDTGVIDGKTNDLKDVTNKPDNDSGSLNIKNDVIEKDEIKVIDNVIRNIEETQDIEPKIPQL